MNNALLNIRLYILRLYLHILKKNWLCAKSNNPFKNLTLKNTEDCGFLCKFAVSKVFLWNLEAYRRRQPNFHQVWRSIVKQSLFHHPHKPFDNLRVVVVKKYALAGVEFEDCVHVVLRELEIEDVEVFCHALLACTKRRFLLPLPHETAFSIFKRY